MKNLFVFIISLQMSFSSYAQSIAPHVINSTGNSYKSGYFDFQWSVGEMAIIGEFANTDNKLTITNGFLQPYFFPVFPDPVGIFGYDEIRIFPNPASDHFEIDFIMRQKGKISVLLTDASGKMVVNTNFDYYGTNYLQTIPVNRLSNGAYILRVNLDPEPGSVHKQGVYNIVVAH